MCSYMRVFTVWTNVPRNMDVEYGEGECTTQDLEEYHQITPTTVQRQKQNLGMHNPLKVCIIR